MILIDTNILTISKQSGQPDFKKVTDRLQQFVDDNEELVICPQNIYEFFVAATRPKDKRGLGLSRKKTLEEIKNLEDTYTFINDPENLFSSWKQIIQNYETSGKQGHDARFVAFMQALGINRFYTLNVSDFNRYSDIITLLN
jgi:predicted nucleic acid-binding protein